MSLRTRFAIAFFGLAVLPLTVITAYSYVSSTRALRHAVAIESARTAEAMERRMGSLTAELDRRVGELGTALPDPEDAVWLRTEDRGGRQAALALVVSALGDAARYFESVELAPSSAPSDTPDASIPNIGPGPKQVRAPILLELTTEIRKEIEFVDAAERVAVADRLGEVAQRVGIVFAQRGLELAQEATETLRTQIESAAPSVAPLRVVEPGFREFDRDLIRRGCVVGQLRARVRTESLVDTVLRDTGAEAGEIPFVIDSNGELHAVDDASAKALRALDILPVAGTEADSRSARPDWIVITRSDPASELTYGLAHPVGESLGELQRSAVRNLFVGLGLIGLALVGTLPLSRRMTRDLEALTAGAERLGRGDLTTRVPVRSRDELGQLGETFNRMATELAVQQRELVEKERITRELQMCRQIQNELLPRAALNSALAEVQGISIPARELGGDFFNFFGLADGTLALLMGDVSGKGVPAALLMANLQATLTARLPLAADLAAFVTALDAEIEASTPPHVYVSLFVAILDGVRGELRWVNAGHPAPYLVRRNGTMDRLDSCGRPVGLLAGGKYDARASRVEPGDSLFLYTDGLLDTEDASGDTFGEERLGRLLAAGSTEPADILRRVETAVREFRGALDAPDDATLLSLRVGALPTP